jgi:plasmid stabilization system protein ParE
VVDFLEEARRELEAAVAWYDEQEPPLGGQLIDELQRVLTRLEALPTGGSLVRHPDVRAEVRQMHVGRFPYRLVYVTVPRLVVLALAHSSRDAAYWRARVL